MSIVFTDILEARRRLAGRIRRTPMVEAVALSALTGTRIRLKLEHRQTTGSFKLRGATNAVLALDPARRARGIVGASTGNHGRALAHAARAAGTRAIICMSSLVPANKVAAIEELGAEARIVGASQDEAQREAERLAAMDGMAMVPPFDMPAVIAGQGTLGLEIMEDEPGLGTVLVPLSGGGLIAGVAMAVKTVNPATRIIGVTMERGAAMHASLAAGRPVEVTEVASLADSLGGGIGLDNRHTFAMVQALVDEVVLVTEAEIAAGMRHAYEQQGEVIEGAAAVGIAAILSGKVRVAGPSAVVLSGKNIAPELHRRVINGEVPWA
jgi:threonine dehydratase